MYIEGELPPSAVGHPVVAAAQQHEILQVGPAPAFPGDDVVRVAVAWRSVAARVGTSAVAGVEGSTESGPGDSCGPAGVDR